MTMFLRICIAVTIFAGQTCLGQVAATQKALTAMIDSFVREVSATGLQCAISPPILVVKDVPSFGSYDPDTNTLTSPAWEQMTAEEQAIFYRVGRANATEADARAEFEAGVHHWVVVHELGHWWQACRRVVDRGDHYTIELQADKIAAAYWNEHDPSLIEHQKALFQAIVERWPNPVPKGQEEKGYFNKNYAALGPTPGYIWFQAQMCLKAFGENPLPSFSAALGRIA